MVVGKVSEREQAVHVPSLRECVDREGEIVIAGIRYKVLSEYRCSYVKKNGEQIDGIGFICVVPA